MSDQRHPSLVEITEALEAIWSAQAIASAPTDNVDIPPFFVWDYARVGRKDRCRDGRYLMPLRTDAPRYVTTNDPLVITARLGETVKQCSYTPQVRPHDIRQGYLASDVAREVLWACIHRAIFKKCSRFMGQLLHEWRTLHPDQGEGSLDPVGLDEVVSAVELGSCHDPILSPLTLHTMTTLVSQADLTKVDPHRWIERFISGRCEFAVRKIVGDVRSGSQIRHAVAHGESLDRFRSGDIQRALSLDMSHWMALEHDYAA